MKKSATRNPGLSGFQVGTRLIMVSSRRRSVVFTALTFITKVSKNKAETQHSKSTYHVFGEHGTFANYGPISMLPAFLKNS